MASLLLQTTLEADARLVKTVGQPQEANFKLFRTWPWLAVMAATGNTVNEIAVSLQGTKSYLNPKADGVTYSGTFIVSSRTGLDDNEKGTDDRAGAIVEELTLVKHVTDVASMGDPIIMSNRETLNYLGFKEGEKFQFYYRYSSLDPADESVAMGLSPTAPTFSGFTFLLVKREFKIEADYTGTLYVTFEADNWPTTLEAAVGQWAAKKMEVEEDSTGGYNLAEQHQLTGVAKANYPTVFTDAKTADTNRVMDMVRVIEKRDGEYQVDRRQKISYAGTAEADSVITKIVFATASTDTQVWRTWWRRTYTAKETLIGSGGAAVSNFSYNSSTYNTHVVEITDHGDGAYTVTQVGQISSGGSVWPEKAGEDSYTREFYKYRTIIDETAALGRRHQYKHYIMTVYVKFTATYASAYSWISSKITATGFPAWPETGVYPAKHGGYKAVYTCPLSISAWTEGDAPVV